MSRQEGFFWTPIFLLVLFFIVHSSLGEPEGERRDWQRRTQAFMGPRSWPQNLKVSKSHFDLRATYSLCQISEDSRQAIADDGGAHVNQKLPKVEEFQSIQLCHPSLHVLGCTQLPLVAKLYL